MGKFLKGFGSVLLITFATFVIGFLLRWGTIGLLSVPTWGTIVLLVVLGKYIYLAVDLLGALSCYTVLNWLADNSKVWVWLSAVGALIMMLNNCLLFWTVDAPYGVTQIIVSGIIMILYVARSVKTIVFIVNVQNYLAEDECDCIWEVKIMKEHIGYSQIRGLVDDEIRYHGWISKDYNSILFLNKGYAMSFYDKNKEVAEKPILKEGYKSSDLDNLICDADLYIRKKWIVNNKMKGGI